MTEPHRENARFRRRYGPWALITGASDGIGGALAAAVAARGLNVVLIARNEDRLHHLADQLHTAHGVDTVVIAADLSEPTAVADLPVQTRQLDIGLVILAAGFGAAGQFTDIPAPDQLAMVDVNVTAVTALSHAFASRLAARDRGGLLLFGSLLGWQGVPGQAVYAATKAYVQVLAEGLRAELRPRGVDVVAVAPGPVRSGFGARAGLTMTSATAPQVVATGALAALGKRGTVVPGARGKFLTAALATLPRRQRTRVLGRVIAKMTTIKPASDQGIRPMSSLPGSRLL
jgi:uncharacterized protein